MDSLGSFRFQTSLKRSSRQRHGISKLQSASQLEAHCSLPSLSLSVAFDMIPSVLQPYGPVSTRADSLPTTPGPSYSQTRPYNRQNTSATLPYNNALPARPNGTYPQTATLSTQQYSQQPQQRRFRYPETYPPGPLAYFLAPPGQSTLDPTLSAPPNTQALHSTYPSRLRTGVTGLVQPETVTGGPRERELLLQELDRELAAARSATSTPRLESPAPYGGSSRRPTVHGRAGGRGTKVNYAEKDESEDSEEESSLSELEEPASDPEDTSYGERRRRDRSNDARPRGRGSAVPQAIDYQASARANRLQRRQEELARGWTWLGDRAPAERVTSSRAQPTAHNYA